MSDEKAVSPPRTLLDCVGLLCPVPVYLMARKLATLPAGAEVEILCDDPTITQDLPSWCRLTGQTIVAHRQEDAVHRYVVSKSSAH